MVGFWSLVVRLIWSNLKCKRQDWDRRLREWLEREDINVKKKNKMCGLRWMEGALLFSARQARTDLYEQNGVDSECRKEENRNDSVSTI